jgi:hypothetical protein
MAARRNVKPYEIEFPIALPTDNPEVKIRRSNLIWARILWQSVQKGVFGRFPLFCCRIGCFLIAE